MKKNVILFLIVIAVSACTTQHKTPFHRNLDNMVERWYPGYGDDFSFIEIVGYEGDDYFEIESSNNHIIISGTNGVAAASGFYWYIKNYCNTRISINFNTSELPEVLPAIDGKIRKETPFEYRNFFNYCTFGYTMSWWHWDRWEKLIDWMAMNGINMPLAITGQEAVWQQLLTEQGLHQNDIDAFLVGPAFLPWGWMGNIDGMAGPLPQHWIDSHIELQQQILERERSFGMTPILQGFTGHIPEALVKQNPNLQYVKTTDWAGMPGTYFLDPGDSLFAILGKRFIEIQTKLYGTDHLYDADCFNEINPPTNDTAFISNVSRKVYESMLSADPEATWIMQGWFLFWQQNFWKEPQARALLDPIPDDKLILLDLYGEKYPVWDKTKAFYGKKWVWNIICNLGQQVNLSGDLQIMNDNLMEAMHSSESGKLSGIGVMMEGFGYNPVVQDLMGHYVWEQDSLNMEKWIRDYAFQRYNTNDERAAKAWDGLLESVYSRTAFNESPISNPPGYGFPEISTEKPYGVDYDVQSLFKSREILASLAKEIPGNKALQFDLVHIQREILSLNANIMLADAYIALENQDLVKFTQCEDDFLSQLRKMDSLLATHEMFQLDTWISDARKWGNTQEEKDYYELNARSILTLWQPSPESHLRDYASRQWRGLVGEFYFHRWERFFEEGKDVIHSSHKVDYKQLNKELREWEYKWINKTP